MGVSHSSNKGSSQQSAFSQASSGPGPLQAQRVRLQNTLGQQLFDTGQGALLPLTIGAAGKIFNSPTPSITTTAPPAWAGSNIGPFNMPAAPTVGGAPSFNTSLPEGDFERALNKNAIEQGFKPVSYAPYTNSTFQPFLEAGEAPVVSAFDAAAQNLRNRVATTGNQAGLVSGEEALAQRKGEAVSNAASRAATQAFGVEDAIRREQLANEARLTGQASGLAGERLRGTAQIDAAAAEAAARAYAARQELAGRIFETQTQGALGARGQDLAQRDALLRYALATGGQSLTAAGLQNQQQRAGLDALAQTLGIDMTALDRLLGGLPSPVSQRIAASQGTSQNTGGSTGVTLI